MEQKPLDSPERASSTKAQPAADNMKRRTFFGKAGLGSAAALAGASIVPAAMAQGHDEHLHEPVTGPLATATVSFGAWQTTPPFDRFPGNTDRTRQQHTLTPYEVTIRAGGVVNFIIAGFHHILVYGDGVKPEDINLGLTIPVSTPPGPLLIDDPKNRIYRGLDPSIFRLFSHFIHDRVEAVHFNEPGTFLVVCGVLPHFLDGMFGYVRVLPCHCQ